LSMREEGTNEMRWRRVLKWCRKSKTMMTAARKDTHKSEERERRERDKLNKINLLKNKKRFFSCVILREKYESAVMRVCVCGVCQSRFYLLTFEQTIWNSL
jgi:hypothetical protein